MRTICSGNESIVAGAGIDVYSVEPPEDLSLVNHPNVICTPHLGAATKEAQANVGTQIAQQFIEMFDGKGIRNAVKPRD
jgi:D-3-phosphoglycerate dehydrogenase